MFSLWVSNVANWQHCSGWRLVYCYCCRCLPSPAQPIYSAPVPHKKPRAALRDINNNHCCCTALASCWIIDCGMRTVRTRDPGLLTTFLFPLPYRSSGGKRGCIFFYLDSWQSFYPQCAEISVCRYSVHCGDWRCCELLLLSCRVWYSYCSILNFVTCAECYTKLFSGVFASSELVYYHPQLPHTRAHNTHIWTHLSCPTNPRLWILEHVPCQSKMRKGGGEWMFDTRDVPSLPRESDFWKSQISLRNF